MANEQELITLLSFKVDDKSAGALRLQAMKLNQHYKQLGAETDKLIAQSNRLGKTLSTAIGQGSNLSAIAEHTKTLSVLNEQFDQTTKRMEALEAQSTLISNAMKKLSEGPKTAFAQSTEAIDKQSASMEQAARSTTHVAQEMSAAEQEVDRLHDAWKAATAAVKDMRYGLANADQELASGLITQQEHADATAWMRKEIERLSDAEKAVLSAFAQADNAFRKQIATVDTATNAQKQHNAELAAGRREAYQYGRVGMSFRAVGRGVARVAGVQTVEPLFAAGDIIRGVRGIKLLQTELPDMWRNLVMGEKAVSGMAAASSGVTAASTGATTGIAAFQARLVAMGATTSGLATLAAGAAAAVGGLAVAITLLRKDSEAAREAAKAAVEANTKYAEAFGDTSSSVRDEIEKNLKEIETLERDRARQLADLDEMGRYSGLPGVEEYAKRLHEIDKQLDALRRTNDDYLEGLRNDETALEDFLALSEKYPDAIKEISEEQLQAWKDAYSGAVGAMTSEETREAIRNIELRIQKLREERNEQKEIRDVRGQLPDIALDAQERIKNIDASISDYLILLDQMETGLTSGATQFADNLAELQKKLGEDDDTFANASQQLIEKMRDISEVRGEIAALIEDPGSPEEVSKQIDDLNAALEREIAFTEQLRSAKAAGYLEEDAYNQAVIESTRSIEQLRLRINLLTNSVLPAAAAAERAAGIEAARQRELDRFRRQQETRSDIALQALSEDDPEAVEEKIRDLNQELTNTGREIDAWHAKLQRGEIDAREHATEVGKLTDKWNDLTYELILTKDVLLPAAQANKDYNDQLEREKELRQELIDQMKTDMQRRTDTRARVLTEEDPQNVIDDIRGIQLEILGWHEYLKDLDGQLKRGLITQELHDEAARQADQSIKALTADMKALKNEVLPAAERTKSFKDLVDEFVAEMELAAEQARVDDDRARRLARDQADFERQRAKALAKHYADLADMDTKLSEAIQKELEKAGKTATDEDKKRLDEEAKFNKQMARLSEDHRLRMLDIARDLSEGLTDAVADRDVQAAIKAIRQAKKKTEEEQEQYELEKKRRWEDYEDRLKQMDDEKKERQKDYRDRIAELRKQHAKERQERINDFNQRLLDEDDERAIAARRQQEDWEREDADRALHYSDQEGKQILHYANLKAIAQFGMIGVEEEVSDAWQRIVGGLRTFSPTPTSYVSSGGYNPLTNRTITQYGTGTSRAKLDEWVLLGDTGPEAARFHGDGRWEVLNPRKTQQALGRQGTQIAISMPVSIHDASNPQQIEAIFESRVLPKLTREVSRAVHARGA